MTRALLLFGCCGLALAQSPAPADWRFAHPDADVKLSVNLQALLKSDAIGKAIAQAKTQAKDNAAQIDMAMAMVRTIDRILISARTKNGNVEDMDVLAEVTGSFDSQVISGMFPNAGKGSVKVLGPHTLLIGEGDSVTQAQARLRAPAGAPSADDELAQSDIWFEATGAILQQQAGAQGGPMLKDLRGFAMGLTLADSPVFDMILTAANDAGASTLKGTFQAMTPLLAAQPQSAMLAKNLSITQDGSKVRMRMVIPPEVVAMLQQQATSAANSGVGLPPQLTSVLSSFGLGGATPAAAAPARHAAEPPPQNGGKVKIYGLDDGPKELSAPK